MEELASVDEGEDDVELLGRLEGELEGNDEGVVDLGEDGTFGEGVGDFGPRDDVGLSDGLESVDPHGVAFTNLHDLGRGERGETKEGGDREWERR
jgi:hypothetical protein